MHDAIPLWFQADKVYSRQRQWYLGSSDALHLGPYPDRDCAKAKSEEICECLRSMPADDQKLAYVRSLLSSEWHDIQANVDLDVLRQAPEQKPRTFPVRQGESADSWARSTRYFNVGSVWFFTTREGIDVGPFENKKEAVEHSRCLLKSLRDKNARQAFQMVFEYKHQDAAA
jgi:hypothetical protein